jgi:hypothetical protein
MDPEDSDVAIVGKRLVGVEAFSDWSLNFSDVV